MRARHSCRALASPPVPLVQLSSGAAAALFWICAAAAVLSQAALLRSAFSPRSAAPADRSVLATSSRAAELAWSLLPAVVLAGVFVWAWTLLRSTPAAP